MSLSTFILLFTLYTLLTNANDINCIQQYGSNCFSNSSTCTPYSVHINQRCDFVQCCCTETLDEPLIDYLSFQYCNTKWAKNADIFNTIFLIICAIYYFRILGNIADDYFSLIMAETSDSLGVSPNISGVTFLAFGNGAPDIGSSIAAIQNGPEQTKLMIAALIGGGVFIPIVVSAAIAIFALKEPTPIARRPFIRDCFFLFFTASFIFIIAMNGTVTIISAVAMIGLYAFYVFTAVLTEIYTKLSKENIVRKTISSTHKKSETFKEKIIMPALGMFSNQSLRDLHIDSTTECTENTGTNMHSFAGGNYQSFGYNEQISTKGSMMDSKVTTTTTTTTATSTANDDDDMETMSDILQSLLSEKMEDRKQRSKFVKIILYFLSIPTLIIDILCKVTIPLTTKDDNGWNDYFAIICCLISPLWILFCFGLFRQIIFLNIELWEIAIFIGILFAIWTFVCIKQKYKNQNNDKSVSETTTSEQNTDNDEIRSIISSQLEMTSTTAIRPKLSQSMINDLTMRQNNGNEQKKVYDKDKKNECVLKYFFLILGFLSSIAWINIVANELVNILTTLGIVSDVDLAILGLTVLAWGFCVGDLLADVGVSKKGYPKMGIAAAIGGPTLNILIGIGLGMLIVCIRDGSVEIEMTVNIFYGCLGLMCGVLFYLFGIACCGRWKLDNFMGYLLLLYYFMFLVVNILAYQFPDYMFDFM